MSGFICPGCKTHGTCIDEQAIKKMLGTERFGAGPDDPEEINQKSTICFETELQNLVDMCGKEGYETKLHEMAQFIIGNSEANDPASLRKALDLQASTSFASWADETAERELKFCNTKSLQKL